mmetsp:Transcript_11571/g.27585  ORF Transcript_11571/g.27585 Transcript_11571/m.27585 type:complete len:281 (-) Transcript_11571:195-1037(-)|eukprot:CAMPEP_0197178104 /NCGR_PEP_ID=MMETSP1423-20130617/3482_1 /TAXON_ID=476441 /ORGANISM="Pseudo-nitzschia heimii, Strain UNC1101" /LENGTH=280 /DNA_ID=CAMNT_0042627769 /DNA_START=145 /DNA_END=987 /DNA_ORIENTATION=+
MYQSILLCLFVLIGTTLRDVNAELTPFYNYKETHEININARNLQSRNPNVQHAVRGRHNGKVYTTGRYGERIYRDDVYDCESFYSKSHKKDKSFKNYKKEKFYKHDKKNCKGYTPKPDNYEHAHSPPGPQDNYKDFVRFIMVREEAGTPSPNSFGVGDTLALSGQIYYWRDYEDNLMNDVPVGTFVSLCTGISAGDDLMCTYEIVLGMLTHKNRNGNPVRGFAASVDGVGAIVANGPNYLGENQMIVTGTEFGFSEFKSGTLITTEDLVNPYLYADLYLL